MDNFLYYVMLAHINEIIFVVIYIVISLKYDAQNKVLFAQIMDPICNCSLKLLQSFMYLLLISLKRKLSLPKGRLPSLKSLKRVGLGRRPLSIRWSSQMPKPSAAVFKEICHWC